VWNGNRGRCGKKLINDRVAWFHHRLALALGCTVAELLGKISPAELLRWQVFDSIEPIGDHGAYLRTGIVTAMNVNVHMGKKGKPFGPEDFMPQKREPETVDPQAASRALKAAFLSVFEDRIKYTDGDQV
jgi:hypothetical protein